MNNGLFWTKRQTNTTGDENKRRAICNKEYWSNGYQ